MNAVLPAGWTPVRDTIVVAPSDVQQLRDEWLRSSGRPPTPPELQASIWRWVADEALFREALRRGLEQDDPVVQQRLLRNLRFAFPDRQQDDAEALRAARMLGMVRQDLVVKRRLVQRMEQRLLSEQRIGEDELRAYVQAHPARYAAPPRYAFEQLFLAGAASDAALSARAADLLRRLRAGDKTAMGEGDGFALPPGRSALSRRELAERFGDGVATAVTAATPGGWIGPVASLYGLHLLRVTRVVPGEPAKFELVRERAARALASERREAHLAQVRARWSARYQVQVPDGVRMDLP